MWTKDDIITSDRILAAFPSNYHKMDVFYSGGRPISWRGRVYTYPRHSETLIITGHSDYPIVNELLNWYPRAHWWGTNNQCEKAHGIPLGITNDTKESEHHPIYGNLDIMVEVANNPKQIRNLVYMNFVKETYPVEREFVWNMFVDKSWVTVGMPIHTLEGRKTFLEDIRNHSFVLCPRGNGIDTHRLWETLYMGNIPIVREDIAHRDWKDLPILFIKDWSEVTEDLLSKTLIDFSNRNWNYNKLKIGYWISNIQNESRNNSNRN